MHVRRKNKQTLRKEDKEKENGSEENLYKYE